MQDDYEGQERRDIGTRPHDVYICSVTKKLYDRATELPLRLVHGTWDLSKDDDITGCVFQTNGITVDARERPILNSHAYSIEGLIRDCLIRQKNSLTPGLVKGYRDRAEKRIAAANIAIDKLNQGLTVCLQHPHHNYDEIYSRCMREYLLEEEARKQAEHKVPEKTVPAFADAGYVPAK